MVVVVVVVVVVMVMAVEIVAVVTVRTAWIQTQNRIPFSSSLHRLSHRPLTHFFPLPVSVIFIDFTIDDKLLINDLLLGID